MIQTWIYLHLNNSAVGNYSNFEVAHRFQGIPKSSLPLIGGTWFVKELLLAAVFLMNGFLEHKFTNILYSIESFYITYILMMI